MTRRSIRSIRSERAPPRHDPHPDRRPSMLRLKLRRRPTRRHHDLRHQSRADDLEDAIARRPGVKRRSRHEAPRSPFRSAWPPAPLGAANSRSAPRTNPRKRAFRYRGVPPTNSARSHATRSHAPPRSPNPDLRHARMFPRVELDPANDPEPPHAPPGSAWPCQYPSRYKVIESIRARTSAFRHLGSSSVPRPDLPEAVRDPVRYKGRQVIAPRTQWSVPSLSSIVQSVRHYKTLYPNRDCYRASEVRPQCERLQSVRELLHKVGCLSEFVDLNSGHETSCRVHTSSATQTGLAGPRRRPACVVA